MARSGIVTDKDRICFRSRVEITHIEWPRFYVIRVKQVPLFRNSEEMHCGVVQCDEVHCSAV